MPACPEPSPTPSASPTPRSTTCSQTADCKYALVIYAAKRARQINAYYSQLQEGLLDYVGPLVETEVHEKPMSIALREINEGLVVAEPIIEVEGEDEAPLAAAPVLDLDIALDLGDAVPEPDES